jgi:hypothetical protein
MKKILVCVVCLFSGFTCSQYSFADDICKESRDDFNRLSKERLNISRTDGQEREKAILDEEIAVRYKMIQVNCQANPTEKPVEKDRTTEVIAGVGGGGGLIVAALVFIFGPGRVYKACCKKKEPVHDDGANDPLIPHPHDNPRDPL